MYELPALEYSLKDFPSVFLFVGGYIARCERCEPI